MKIIFAGDSITKGTDYGGVTSTDTFAYKIGIANGYSASNIINSGVASNTSADVLARLTNDVISLNPAVVVLMIGMNDWKQGIPIATYQANIESIFTQLKSAGIKTVGITSSLQRGDTSTIQTFQGYLQAFESAAYKSMVNIIDLYREIADAYLYFTTAQFYAIYADSLHLSVVGHQFVTDLCGRPSHAGVFLA